MRVRTAFYEEDHADLVKFARGSKYIRDFSNHIFSGEAMYKKNWIRMIEGVHGEVLGFYCVRHKVREPLTELYFIMTSAEHKGQGIGRMLIEDMKAYSPHRCIGLNCAKDNAEGIAFYDKLGAKKVGESLGGKAYRYEIRW